MPSKFCATTGTVYEIIMKNASDFYCFLLHGTNRCAEKNMCFAVAFDNTNTKTVFGLHVSQSPGAAVYRLAC